MDSRVRLPEASSPQPLGTQHHYNSNKIYSLATKRALVGAWMKTVYPKFRARYSANFAILEQIVKKCIERGLHPVLVDLPRLTAVIGHAWDAPIRQYHKGCWALKSEYQVPFYNCVLASGCVHQYYFVSSPLIDPALPKFQEQLSNTIASLLRPETVKTRGLAVAGRLMVTAATSDGAAPGDARSATDAGSFGVAPQAVQGTRTVHAAPPATVTLDVGEDFTMVGVTCDVPPVRGAVVIRIRTSLDGGSWSRWYEGPLELAADGAGAPRAFMDAMWTGAARYVQVSARADGARAPLALDGVRLMAIDTGGSDSLGDRTAAIVRRLVATIAGVSLTPAASAAVSQPTWVTRKAWGADESLRSGTPDTAPVKMAFIHHTAGGNTYAQADAPALVRGIYAYHTLGLGWSDIGYNFLIDRFGTIYEGRYGGVTKGVIGAQVLGFNTGSTGISVMGTYSSATPPTA